MPAVVLALVAAIGYSGSDYAAGLATRRASVVRVTVIAEVTHAAALMCVVPFISSRAPSLGSAAWGVAAGISGVAGAMALYLGFRHAAFSVASSVSAVCSAAFSVLAGLLLGERPGALPLAGIALALPAIAAVSMSRGEPGTGEAGTGQAGGSEAPVADTGGPDPARHPGRSAVGHAAGVIWGLIAGAAFGFFFISLNRAGSATDVWPLAIAGLTAVVTVACIAVATRQLGLPPPGTRWLSVLTGVTAFVGTLAYYLATHLGLLAVTAVITSLYPAGTIVLARVLSGERLTTVRVIGLCLGAISVTLIAAGGAG